MGKDKRDFIVILLFLLIAAVLIDIRESLTGKQILDVDTANVEERAEGARFQIERNSFENYDSQAIDTAEQLEENGFQQTNNPLEKEGAQDITIFTFTFRTVNNEKIIDGPSERIDMKGFLPPSAGEWSYKILSEEGDILYKGYVTDPTKLFVDELKNGELVGGLEVLDEGKFLVIVPTEVIQKASNININVPREDRTLSTSMHQALSSPTKESSSLISSQVVAPIQPIEVSRCNTLIDNGDPKKKLDIVFVGSNWKSTQDLQSAINKLTSVLLNLEPFRSNKKEINVHLVTPSTNAGIHCHASGNPNIDIQKIVAAASICPYDKIAAIVNSDIGYGGFATGGDFSCSAFYKGTVDKDPYLAPHEIGHTFTLADEYELGVGFRGFPALRPTCDSLSTCPFMTSLGLTCYDGCEYIAKGDRFRDHEKDIMRNIDPQSPGFSGGYGPIDIGVIKSHIDYFANKMEEVTVVYPSHLHRGNTHILSRTHGGTHFLRGTNSAFYKGVKITGLDVVEDENNFLYMSFYDVDEGTLYYLNHTPNEFEYSFTKIDTAINSPQFGWESSIALDNNGRPAIAYSNEKEIKYAWYDGKEWKKEVVYRNQIVSPYVGLAFDSKNIPHIVWGNDKEICLSSGSGSSRWGNCDLIGTGGGTGGHYADLAIDSQDRKHITYVDKNGLLQYIRLGDTPLWVPVEKSGAFSHSTLTLDIKGNVHLVYLSSNPYGLKYAKFNGYTWEIKWADEGKYWPRGASFSYNDVGVDKHGNVFLAYLVYDGKEWVNIVFYDLTNKYKRNIDYDVINPPRNRPVILI